MGIVVGTPSGCPIARHPANATHMYYNYPPSPQLFSPGFAGRLAPADSRHAFIGSLTYMATGVYYALHWVFFRWVVNSMTVWNLSAGIPIAGCKVGKPSREAELD